MHGHFQDPEPSVTAPAQGGHCVDRCPALYSTHLSHNSARVEHRNLSASVSGGGSAMADYIYLVQMDIPAELEDECNRIYDTEHVPNILKAPGVHGCTRYRLETTNAPGMARYAALYEIDSPDVPSSAGWLAESEKGAWPTKIRAHTTNRSHSIFKRLP